MLPHIGQHLPPRAQSPRTSAVNSVAQTGRTIRFQAHLSGAGSGHGAPVRYRCPTMGHSRQPSPLGRGVTDFLGAACRSGGLVRRGRAELGQSVGADRLPATYAGSVATLAWTANACTLPLAAGITAAALANRARFPDAWLFVGLALTLSRRQANL